MSGTPRKVETGRGEHAHSFCFQPRDPGKQVLGACSCLSSVEVSTHRPQVSWSLGCGSAELSTEGSGNKTGRDKFKGGKTVTSD